MASSFPTRARHVTERAKVLRAFPLRLHSIFFPPAYQTTTYSLAGIYMYIYTCTLYTQNLFYNFSLDKRKKSKKFDKSNIFLTSIIYVFQNYNYIMYNFITCSVEKSLIVI